MPLPRPGGPPGGAGGSTSYPQWGVKLDKTKQTGQIAEAHNDHEKISDINAGYLQWFKSRQAAKNWIPTQFGIGSGNLPIPNPLSGINAIGDFFARLTDPHTWVRVGEVVAGSLILYLGLKAIVTPSGQDVGRQTVKSTGHHIAHGVKRAAEFAAMPK